MSKLKGWIGEKVAQLGLWVYLDKAKYKRLHNLILETKNGSTEIDHVYLSVYGLFVVETKHLGGWIFGDEKSPYWTQRFSNGKKFKFPNPLHQNYKHTQAISESTGVNHDFIHSIVHFIGEDVKIKTDMPENVVISPYQVARYIKQFDKPIIKEEDLSQIENILLRLKGEQISARKHVRNLKARYQNKENCPKCGKPMVERQSSKDKSSFIACSGYPKCKYIYRD